MSGFQERCSSHHMALLLLQIKEKDNTDELRTVFDVTLGAYYSLRLLERGQAESCLQFCTRSLSVAVQDVPLITLGGLSSAVISIIFTKLDYVEFSVLCVCVLELVLF